jgi:hypothetical protein
MKLLDIFRKRRDEELKAHGLDVRVRRQLNMMIDYRLCDSLKDLSKELTVPRNVLGEHVIEVGIFYVGAAMENEGKMKLMRKHLIDSHLIDDGFDDDEAIIRIGEAGGISGLVAQAERVLDRWHAFQQALQVARRTRSADYLTKCEHGLLVAAVEMATWIDKHGLFDDPPDSEGGRGQGGT